MECMCNCTLQFETYLSQYHKRCCLWDWPISNKASNKLSWEYRHHIQGLAGSSSMCSSRGNDDTCRRMTYSSSFSMKNKLNFLSSLLRSPTNSISDDDHSPLAPPPPPSRSSLHLILEEFLAPFSPPPAAGMMTSRFWQQFTFFVCPEAICASTGGGGGFFIWVCNIFCCIAAGPPAWLPLRSSSSTASTAEPREAWWSALPGGVKGQSNAASVKQSGAAISFRRFLSCL